MKGYSRMTLAVALLVFGGPAAASGQSLLGSGGLGVPIPSTDARTRGLGGIGLGLMGTSILPNDPASAADLRTPGIAVTFAPTTVDVTSELAEESASANRFPLLGVSYPIGGLAMATVTLSGLLDQRWDSEIARTIDTGDGEAQVTDRFESDGGVSVLSLGIARRINPTLAVGVSVGRYTGQLDRVLTRSFDSLALETNVPPVEFAGRWSYSGTTATAGAMLDVGDFARVSGSVTVAGTLTAEPDEDTAGGDQEFGLPTTFRVGATGELSPVVRVVVGASFADWSDASLSGFEGGGGRSTANFGGAVELEPIQLFGRTSPLRFGYRSTDYPFLFEGEEVTETAFTSGLGFVFLEAQGIPFAQFDFSLERGDRSAGTVEESFWLVGLSLRVAGF